MTGALSPDEAPSEVVGGEGHGLLTLPDGRSIPFKAHPLANLFPMMTAEEHAALVEDVKARGVQRPIVLLDQMVLDGRNRYMAARDANVGYRVVEFTGDDPLAFVISENMRRRHLTDSQRAMVAAKIAKLNRSDTLIQNRSADLRNGPTTAEAAQMMSVPVRTVEAARAVVRDGAAELVAAVETGAVKVSSAAQIAKLPEAEQAQIVAQGPEAVRAAAKEVRTPKVKDEADPPPTEPVDPERRKLAKLTTEALIDEALGLRANLADEKAKTARLKNERESLAAKLAEALSGEQGKVIGSLQRQLDQLKGRIAEHQTAAKRWERRAVKAEARVKELEEMEVVIA